MSSVVATRDDVYWILITWQAKVKSDRHFKIQTLLLSPPLEGDETNAACQTDFIRFFISANKTQPNCVEDLVVFPLR